MKVEDTLHNYIFLLLFKKSFSFLIVTVEHKLFLKIEGNKNSKETKFTPTTFHKAT